MTMMTKMMMTNDADVRGHEKHPTMLTRRHDSDRRLRKRLRSRTNVGAIVILFLSSLQATAHR